jgi:hypothetical protein
MIADHLVSDEMETFLDGPIDQIIQLIQKQVEEVDKNEKIVSSRCAPLHHCAAKPTNTSLI